MVFGCPVANDRAAEALLSAHDSSCGAHGAILSRSVSGLADRLVAKGASIPNHLSASPTEANRHRVRVHRVTVAGGADITFLKSTRLGQTLTASAVRRISSYCLPRNLRKKSQAEINELAAAGLALVYVGAESGDDEVLRKVNKGETFETTRDALDKLGAAGITRSVMLLNGLGGPTLSRAHAENSARLANATQPEFLATLVVSFPQGEERFRAGFPEWEPLDLPALFREMETFLQALELRRTVFRSDHASNWLVLKGTLGAEKDRLLAQVVRAFCVPVALPSRAIGTDTPPTWPSRC